MANTGSFGTGLGPEASQAIQEAIDARAQGGQPTPALSQVTPASPQGQPPVTPDVTGQPPMPQASPKPPSSEAEVILKAMSDRLKTISKVESGGL